MRKILFLLLFIALLGCSSKTSQTSPSGNAPYWVSECDVPSQWYCGSGKNNAEAMRNMVEQMRVKVESETEQVTNIVGKDAQLNYKQKINISTGDIEVAGIEKPWTSSNGTIHVAVNKEKLVDLYGYKIKNFFHSADTELERAEADTEKGNTKLALKKINAIKDTLENNLDSWVTILHVAGGRGSDSAGTKKRELLLLADSLNREICKTAKLHWKSGQDDIYSNVAFSKLSNRLKMEKASCKDYGVSLDYKNEEPHCSYIHGLYKCSCRIFLSIASCEGVEHLLLENSAEGVHQKKEFALDKMQNNLKEASFWETWEKEVREWVPQCVN